MNMDEEVKKKLTDIANKIDDELPENYGFCLLTFGFNNVGKELMYVANANREDIVKVMKEWITKTENNFGNDTGKY